MPHAPNDSVPADPPAAQAADRTGTPTTRTPTARTPTAIDAVADAHFDTVIALSPIEATSLGVPGHDDRLDDLSPEGHAARTDAARRTLAALDGTTPTDDVDRVTLAAMRERLGLQIALDEAGYTQMDVNVIASPLQACRDVLDLMPTGSAQDWSVVAARIAAIPTALQQWTTTLRVSAARGQVSAHRQIAECITQCHALVADDGYFAELVAGARIEPAEPGAPAAELPGAVRADLERAAGGARSAYSALAEALSGLLDQAPRADGVGRERYRLASQVFLGASIDLAETYAWGQQELARITAEMQDTARRITANGSTPSGNDADPSAGLSEMDAALRVLEADERYLLRGTEALREWMQGKADDAISALADVHFDIPEPVRRIECRIAPTQTGGIYYTGPSDDFARPGRMWWSVPKGDTEFRTWSELSTVYHEGVPGHHLQIGQTVYRRELLNKWRRMMCWVSGHGEGWALYAERLMAELGFMDDPGNYLGLLDAQSLRAARVVLDIGVHCGFEAPAELGGGDWTYEKAWDFLGRHARLSEGMRRFELHRYLGWPGQAPSYKIGERLWLQLREETAARQGSAFSLKDFHRRALDLGSVGLDVLREAVTELR